jgi:Rieske Fe-S protein
VDRDRRLLCQAGLAIAAGAAAGCGAAPMGSGDMGTCSGNAVGVGNAGDVSLNHAVKHSTPAASVFICRDGGGLYAFDAGCTHLGCDVMPRNMNDVSQGFFCMCHGATYDANGQHPTAPAPRPLAHYQLCVQPSGALIVDATITVDASTRLKV